LSEWPFKIKLGFHSVAETFFKEKEKKNDNNFQKKQSSSKNPAATGRT